MVRVRLLDGRIRHAAIQHARFYALEAERRMGELLAASERAKRGPDKDGGQRSQRITSDPSPTLADLGLNQKARWRTA